jgi:hypothetical protein
MRFQRHIYLDGRWIWGYNASSPPGVFMRSIFCMVERTGWRTRRHTDWGGRFPADAETRAAGIEEAT